VTSDGTVDLRTLSDLATPWCVRVAATLGVAEHIDAGTTAVGALAAACGCDADSLKAVLDHLAGRGVFERDGSGGYALNDAARRLLDPAFRLFLDLDGVGGRFAGAWASLLEAVRTGRCTYDRVFGLPFWEDLDAHPAIAASFDALMGREGHGTPDADVLADGDWSAVRTVVDVGGGTGALLAELLRAHPTLRATLVDLPRTVARSHAVFESAGVQERVTVRGQSFFDPLPAGADLYVLKAVLNDWPDAEATAILRRCADAARPAGRVVIVGGVTPEGARGGGISPDMLVARGIGGPRRTVERLDELAEAAGLSVHAHRQGAGDRISIECRPRTDVSPQHMEDEA